MKIRNIIKGGVVLAGVAVFAAGPAPARADGLQSPDSDTLVAGYQVIKFNLKECMAITTGPNSSANGTTIIGPKVRGIANKMCSESREYYPQLEALAKSKNFDLPTNLPTYLTARYAALVRNYNGNMAQQYLQDQISSHEDAVAIFQLEVATGTDPDVKAAAQRVLPVMEENLATLRALAGSRAQ